MNVEQMKTVVKEIISRTDLTPCVVGHRGVGKTAGIIQICRDTGHRYLPLRLGQMEVGDLVGIPYREGGVMHWSRPSWWPGDDDPEAIIHCDELNRAQQEDTLQAIFQFVEPPAEGQNRALHTHKLHRRHKVVVTINPPDGTYQVSTLDRALIDRMVMLYVESDYSCWSSYAASRGLDDGVRGFLAANQQLLASTGAPLDIDVEPTERGWEMVSILRKSCRLPRELEMEVYSGIVGKEAAVMFLRWCADERKRPVSGVEILENWPEVSGRVASQRDDLQAATVGDIILLLQRKNSLSEVEEMHLMAYISCLSRDLRFGFVKSLLRIPYMAVILSEDRNDGIILEAIQTISIESGSRR